MLGQWSHKLWMRVVSGVAPAHHTSTHTRRAMTDEQKELITDLVAAFEASISYECILDVSMDSPDFDNHQAIFMRDSDYGRYYLPRLKEMICPKRETDTVDSDAPLELGLSMRNSTGKPKPNISQTWKT
jgi:hypothetical protein